MASFWGACAFADLELPSPLTWGVVKGLLMRNIRFWVRQRSAYHSDGTLTIGYVYPNHNMTENYNSPGSPYWCCKSFITLALSETHPFWVAQELPYPAELLGQVKLLRHPLHIASNLGGHSFILSSGQQCSYPVKQGPAKYGKLAYSSAFGYSVPVGSGTLEELGGDNTLALSDDDGETWKCRRDTREARFEDDKWLRSMWYPYPDVEVETWLIPPMPDAPLWHVRVHRMRTGRTLQSAEGGFAIYGQREDGRALEPSDGEKFGTYEDGGQARAVSKAGISAIADLLKNRRGVALRTDANTNLMVPRAVLPTLIMEHEAKESDIWLAAAVFGLPNPDFGLGLSSEKEEEGVCGWYKEWETRPIIPQEIVELMKDAII